MTYVLGIFFCLVMSFFGLFLSEFFPSIGHISLSLMTGILLGNFFKLPNSVKLGCSFSEKRILEFSIALLGFNLSRHELGFLDTKLVVILISMVVLVILLSVQAGKWLKFPGDLALLIGVGSGVCGSAAIMASAQVLKSSKKDIVLSLAITQFLGMIAMFLLPFLLNNFDKSFSAYMIGGSLQAMGHVVAATSLLDAESASIAITVKMMRILLLSPLVLILSFYVSSKTKNTEGGRVPISVPLYTLFFILFLFIANYFELPASFTMNIKKISNFLFAIAMAGLGSNIKFAGLSKGFGRYMSFATVLFVLQCVFLLVARYP